MVYNILYGTTTFIFQSRKALNFFAVKGNFGDKIDELLWPVLHRKFGQMGNFGFKREVNFNTQSKLSADLLLRQVSRLNVNFPDPF